MGPTPCPGYKTAENVASNGMVTSAKTVVMKVPCAMVASVAMLQGVTKSRQLMRTLTPYSLSDAMSQAPKVNDSRL